jgi:uncharacterized protein (DUF362 family)/Pyruvate/2-oxoacid:ferredoxin oxidoreductase delta subunit
VIENVGMNAQRRVSLQALTSYKPLEVKNALINLLAPLGGIGCFVKPGQNVLLKPNLLAGKPPERAVTTHPALIRAVAELIQETGARVWLGDSPGIGSAETVARKCGIMAVVEELGIEFRPFDKPVAIRPRGRTFQHLEIAADILAADVVINLPKLKTHQMMGLTCGVKNMFGAVIGLRKPQLHLKAGSDKALFALMLLELCEQIAPALTIVDAVVGMEGDGPGSGDPVAIGALIAGSNPLAVDAAAIDLLGMKPAQVWTQKLAIETGRSGSTLEQIELCGTAVEDLRMTKFRPAKNTGINGSVPVFLENLLKQALTARPEPVHPVCTRCGICVDICPPQAMKIHAQKLFIDEKKCIRCFCCQELCPQGALQTRQGWLLKMSRRLYRQD